MTDEVVVAEGGGEEVCAVRKEGFVERGMLERFEPEGEGRRGEREVVGVVYWEAVGERRDEFVASRGGFG